MTIPIRLNGSPVSDLSLHMPINGAWSAEIHCADGVPFIVGSTATLTMPGQSLVGRVVRSQLYAERVQVRMSGGLSDWQQSVTGLNYGKVQADKVLSDMGVVTDQALSTQLNFWTRLEGTIGQSIQLLAKHLSFNWRINPNGTVRIKSEDPVKVEPEAIETYRDESRGMIELAIEKAVVLPGCLVGDDSVGEVIYTLKQDGRLVCRYWTEGRGRVLERYVRWVTRDQIYLGTYTAKVVRQAADGTLDLLPEDSRLRGTGLQSVPILHGLPGCIVRVPNGERVLLAFDGGDPSKPYASLWHEGQVTSIELGGTLKVALASLVKAELDRIATVFDAHIHAVAAAPGSTAPTLTLISPIAEVASQKLSTE